MNLISQDFAEPVLEADDLAFFVSDGFRKLMRAMLKQSIKDIVTDRKDSHAAADVSASARWPLTPGGRDCIEFLMPGITPELVIAKIYKDPQRVLDAMERVDSDLTPHIESTPVFTLQAAAAAVFDAADEELLALQAQSDEDDLDMTSNEYRPWA